MRIGTFICWLFGHKFIGKSHAYSETLGYYTSIGPIRWCRRCGILRPEGE